MTLTDAQWRALKALETGEESHRFMVSWMALADRRLVYWPKRFIEGRPILTEYGRKILASADASPS